MKVVNFQMFVDRDNSLPDLLGEPRTVEFDIEAEVSTDSKAPKLVNITQMSLNGRELDPSEIEDISMEIGWKRIEDQALETLYSSTEEFEDTFDLEIEDVA